VVSLDGLLGVIEMSALGDSVVGAGGDGVEGGLELDDGSDREGLWLRLLLTVATDIDSRVMVLNTVDGAMLEDDDDNDDDSALVLENEVVELELDGFFGEFGFLGSLGTSPRGYLQTRAPLITLGWISFGSSV